ncbi:hypothetical protein QI052_13395 [Staphylococcus saprophyticus]|nr:hypothetical protein [Staphylococcus saprophyticus]
MDEKKLEEINRQIESELLEGKYHETKKNNDKSSNMNKPRAIFLCVVLFMGIVSFLRMFI